MSCPKRKARTVPGFAWASSRTAAWCTSTTSSPALPSPRCWWFRTCTTCSCPCWTAASSQWRRLPAPWTACWSKSQACLQTLEKRTQCWDLPFKLA
uniref:Uncharacterized protein n=1 Tax=Ixodes scapularis TaxID=6945 RepID=A0A4D5RBI3_IXOSC